MKYLKTFNESSEEKLYWEIPFTDEYYNDLPCEDFNTNYAKSILTRLQDEWFGKLVRHSGVWLDLTTNDGEKSCSVFQSEDDYFFCDYVCGPDADDMKIFQCDTFQGLQQFLKSEDIII